MSKNRDLHIQPEDTFEIQLFNADRDLWELWGLASNYTGAQQVVDYARSIMDVSKVRIRIVRR